MTNDEFTRLERSVLIHDHVKRYAAIRRFCYGDVIDIASGCGYGTLMISTNPEVRTVLGVDTDEGAIAWGKKEFSNEKITYEARPAEAVQGKFDTLVCLETIEHIEDASTIPELTERTGVNNVILSFPDKKTTHYNPHHVRDFNQQDVLKLFPNHVLYHRFRITDTSVLLLTRKPAGAPSDMYNNLTDLRS